jgi:hypothetical protein
MAIFKASGIITVSCWTEIEAETKESAMEIAKRREPADFHIDGNYEVTDSWYMDNGGVPSNIEIEG